MTTRPRGTAFSFLRQLRARDVFLYVLVFGVCFCTAKLGQYLFYTAHIAPAVIWPPFGIALGAMLVGGYRMWLPVALAELLAAYSIGLPLPIVIAITVGATLQPFLGALLMNKLHFDGKLSHLGDALILMGTALVIPTVAPTIMDAAAFFSHTLTVSFIDAWTRGWVGGMLSFLITTTLITTWIPFRPFSRPRREIETTLAFGALVIVTFILAWTPYGDVFGLSGLYALVAILVWISIRMRPRLVMLAFFLLYVVDMAGIIFVNPSGEIVAPQVFSSELVIEILAVMFITIAALSEERRLDRIALEKNVEELGQALRRIEGQEAARTRFIATLAHELRNPLAPVVSALDLLALQNVSSESLPTIENAQRELDVMRRILDDILDVARVAQEKFKLQTEIVDARALIEHSIENTKLFMQNRKHKVTMTLPKEPVLIEVDPVRFEQIIVNLLNNAGKYTPAGGKIDVTCTKEDSYAAIHVRDNGIGISPEHLKEVFEAFRQIRPMPQVGTGLGIGLWLTKRLVGMHGGKIEVTSEGLGHGSVFTVYFPLSEGPHTPAKKSSARRSAIPSMKILIVDDNEAAAQAMQKLLTLKGHDAEVATDGAAAIDKAATFLPRAILLDIGLPDMSGYDVARKLKDTGSTAALIALTGYGQEEDKQKSKDAGFDFHLTKPAGIADIEAILTKITS